MLYGPLARVTFRLNGNILYRSMAPGRMLPVHSDTSHADLASGPLNITTYFRRITSTDVCSYILVSETVLVIVKDPVILNAGVLYSDNACLFPGNSPYPIGTKVKPAGGVLPYIISWEAKTETGNWQTLPGEQGDKLFPGPITKSTSYRKKIEDGAGTIVYTDPVLLSVISAPLKAGTRLRQPHL